MKYFLLHSACPFMAAPFEKISKNVDFSHWGQMTSLNCKFFQILELYVYFVALININFISLQSSQYNYFFRIFLVQCAFSESRHKEDRIWWLCFNGTQKLFRILALLTCDAAKRHRNVSSRKCTQKLFRILALLK